MRCKLCERWRARQWEKSDAWERAHSNESELWWEEPVRNRALIQQAYASGASDPAAAFQLYLEAAEAGSAWAMEAVAWHFRTGAGVAVDPGKADDYYRRAVDAGSWIATISYARFLADSGRHDECERLLEDGVAADFVPACFWLAWFRLERCRSRAERRELRPLLEHAATRGHPVARIVLAQSMIWGKFGLRQIPAGLLLTFRWAGKPEKHAAARPAAVLGHRV